MILSDQIKDVYFDEYFVREHKSNSLCLVMFVIYTVKIK